LVDLYESYDDAQTCEHQRDGVFRNMQIVTFQDSVTH